MTKRFLLVAVLVLAVAVAAGCARGGDAPATDGSEAEPQESRAVTEQSEELAGAVTEEQQERMEQIVAEYPVDELDPERGECNVCHVGENPWDQGGDLGPLVSSMVDAHTETLDPQLNAEVNAYFLRMVEERQ